MADTIQSWGRGRQRPRAGFSAIPNLIAIAVFAFSLVCVIVLDINQKAFWLDEQKIIAQSRLAASGRSLESGIARRSALLGGLAAMATLHGADGLIRQEYPPYAEGLLGGDPVIKAVSLYPPDGTVLVYPVEGNQAILHRRLADLIADIRPIVHRDVERTIRTRKSTFSDPFPLLSGTVGVAARKAIFIGGKLWGIAEIALDLEILLEDSGFKKGNPGLRLALTDTAGKFFSGEQIVLFSDPVRYTIPLPEGQWTVSAIPSGGWMEQIRSRLLLLRIAGFLFSLLLAIVVRFLLVRAMAQAKRISDQDRDLAENSQRLSLAVEASKIGFFDQDIASGKVLHSPEYERQLGFVPGEMPSEDTFWVESLHPEDKDATLRTVGECREGRKSEYEVEYRLRHRDGSWRWILGRGKTLNDAGGKPLHFLGCHVDITRLKTAEESLRRSEERYRAIMQNLPLGIIHIMDRNFRYVFDSGEEMERLGLSESMLLGKSIYEVLEPGTVEFVARQYRKVLAGESVRYEGNFRDEAFLIQAAPLRGVDGSVEQILVLSINITERKIAEQKLVEAHTELKKLLEEADRSRLALLSLIEDHKFAEKKIKKLNTELEGRVRDRTARLEIANKELEAFSYSISHDLRSPLRAMNGFASVLKEEYGSVLDEKATHYLNRIREASLRMGQLINDLLSLSRLSRASLSRDTVDLSAVARKIADGLRDSDPGRSVAFEIEPGMTATGDHRLFEIMMDNLLGNAWKYSGKNESAAIRVGSMQEDGETVFFVKDNGVGFDMAYADRLFVPFHRLHGMEEFPGTGIGLVTVRRIIERHGGRIWPEAVKGEGATFYFTLSEAAKTPKAQ